MKTLQILVTFILFYSQCAYTQQIDSSFQRISVLPARFFNKITIHQHKLENQITNRTQKYLAKLQNEESIIHRKIALSDPSLSKTLFSGSSLNYRAMDSSLNAKTDSSSVYRLKEYLPGMDSLQTAVNFISKNKSSASVLSAEKLTSIGKLTQEMNSLQAKINTSSEIEQLVRQRQSQLENALIGSPMIKYLQGFKTQAFYYQQQVKEYKEMLHDPDKLERKVIAAVNDNPAFKTFMGKYSYLAELFGVPESYGSNINLDGLQTRGLVEQLVTMRMGSSSSSSGSDPSQYVQQQMQNAQQAVSALKNKLQQLGSSGDNEDILQPNFQPNSQHTKTFMQRLEYGFDLQSQGSSSFQAATVNIGVSAGYKFNDKASAGFGITYNVGVGHPINHIHLSSQGLGFRSYVNIKIKYNFWFSGGMEYNYLSAFRDLNTIKNLDVWQKSALMGLMKTIRITKNRQSTVQLLFDAMYKQHKPQSSPLVFRMGYKF